MASTSSTQPDRPPESWQLSGPALGYLVVLAPTDLLKPRARIAIHSETIAIGSSQALADIQFKHPHFDPVHLKLSLASDHVASIQVFGSTGVRFHDGRHLYPPIDGQQPPWTTLRDRELFYISQFPFVWEQRWDSQQIDWSRFNHDLNMSSSELSASSQAPSAQQSPTPTRSRSPISSSCKSNAPPLSNPNGSPLRSSLRTPSSSKNQPSTVKRSPMERGFSPQSSDDVLRLDITSTEKPPSLMPDLDPEMRADASQAATHIPQDTPQAPNPTDNRPDTFHTPRANRHHAKGKGSVNGAREPSSRLVITPVKADADVAFHWEQPDSDMSRKGPSPSQAFSDLVESSDPESTESFDSWKPNVSFRRRSYRRSVELVSQKRVRINGPADDSSSGEDDDDDDEAADFQDDQQEDSIPTLPNGNTPLLGSSPRATSPSASADISSSPRATSPSATPDVSPPSSAEDTHRPRRKSLLQKILIKQAVEVHLAQQNEQDEPVGASGFSSSEEDDDDQANMDEIDSTDEELLPDSEPIDDSSDDEQEGAKSDRMPEQTVCSSPMIVDKQSSSQLAGGSPVHPVSPAAIFSTRNCSAVNPMLHLVPPAPVSVPSTLPRSLHDRRSISPNAKLLATFALEQSAPGTSSPPASMVEFPLKSSFRRQSYTPEELSNFSKSLPFQRNAITPSRPASSAAVKHNTHLNSRSPSYPLKDEERLRADRRTSLRGSTPAPCSNQLTPSPTKKTAVVASPLGHPSISSSPSPHRLIRTPRSFLIKRGGSLTPLSASVCGPDPTIPVADINEDEDDQDGETDEGGKRKVRFDRDVFCLEFDQLPEELPTSRQPKKPKLDPGPAPEADTEVGITSGSSNRRASTGSSTSNRNARRRPTGSLSNPPNRPRRHSPRLPAPSPAQLISVSEPDDAYSDVNCAHATAPPSASVCPTVDISGLSLNPDSLDRQRASSEGPPDSNTAREVPLRQFGGYPELGVADNQLGSALAVERSKGTEDSIFHNLTSRLFNFSTTGTARKRCTSLPPDLSKLTYVANPNLKKLEEKMHGLSLVTVPSEGADLLERCYSAPSSSLAVSGRSRFPMVSHFSPQLVGVKQMFMEQFGMASLGGLRTMLGAFRPERESASSSESSESVDDAGGAAGEKDESEVRQETGCGSQQPAEACKDDTGLPASLAPLSAAPPRPRRRAAARVQPQPEEPTRMLRPRANASQTEQAPVRRTRAKDAAQPKPRPLAKKASQADMSTEQNPAHNSGSKPGSGVGATCTRSTRSRARTGSSSVVDQQAATNNHHLTAGNGHSIGQSDANGPVRKGRSKVVKS